MRGMFETKNKKKRQQQQLINFYHLALWGFSRNNEINNKMKYNVVKNPNWLEENHLAILLEWPWTWTQDYREQMQQAVRARFELRTSELEVQRSNHSDTLPPSFFEPWKQQQQQQQQKRQAGHPYQQS